MKYDEHVAADYKALWDTCATKPWAEADAEAAAHRCFDGRERYELTAEAMSLLMPWYFVALVHHLESGSRFDRHLHNGDPLTARTVHVPVGRPPRIEPPFTWETSALDALSIAGCGVISVDWSIPGTLFQLEKYNGFGYRAHDVNTPYVWSGTNHYARGKFTADGHFDPAAVSKQIGAAAVLRHLLLGRPTAT